MELRVAEQTSGTGRRDGREWGGYRRILAKILVRKKMDSRRRVREKSSWRRQERTRSRAVPEKEAGEGHSRVGGDDDNQAKPSFFARFWPAGSCGSVSSSRGTANPSLSLQLDLPLRSAYEAFFSISYALLITTEVEKSVIARSNTS